MPWALCFGVPPAAIMVGGMPIPKWTDEARFIGVLIGNPVEVVKCETNDIGVPANAEIVFGGTVSISETAPEGPMMEYHGHVWPDQPKNALCSKSTPSPIQKIRSYLYASVAERLRKTNCMGCDDCRRAPEYLSGFWLAHPECVLSV